MNINDMFPSKYLKADEIETDTNLTITTVTQETLGQGDDARTLPIVYFTETEKGLVLNKTNGGKIANATGIDDMRKWVGVKMKLFEDEVEFNGQMRPSIKVRLPKTQPKAEAEAPTKGAKKYADKEIEEDEIPF